MDSFKTYYYSKLRQTPSEEYEKIGEYGKCLWDHMICEGLITTYPKDLVEKEIENIKSGDDWSIFDNYDESLIKVYVTPIKNSPEDILKILKSKIDVYGYIVGKILKPDHFGTLTFLLEPKHVKEIDPKIIRDLYHITHKKNLDKIHKIGLVPRDSTTIFSHPGNRIYLLTVNDKNELSKIAETLNLGRKEMKGVNPPKHLQNKTENMIFFKIDKNGLGNLYEDPMFGGYQNLKGYFTTQNIAPQFLKLVT